MKVHVWLLALGSVVLLWGCGQKSTVVTGGDGTVTTSGDGKVKIEDSRGNTAEFDANSKTYSGKNEKGETFSMGAGTVSEEDLGLPFYPGSSPVEGSDVRAKTDQGSTFVSSRTTSDAPAKVAAFYKDKLTDVAVNETAESAVLSGKLKDGRSVGISSVKTEGKTQIQVTVTQR